ncbi:hypothetical protein MHAE_09340 [Mycobacterium haemophilum DSM 44634]
MECKSADSPSQIAAEARIEPDPGPAYIRAEFTSGGNIVKLIEVLHLMVVQAVVGLVAALRSASISHRQLCSREGQEIRSPRCPISR